MHVLRFDQVGTGDIALVGGKGANLGEMARAGLAVPPGFCVTASAYREFVESAGLWPAVEALLRSVPAGDTVRLEEAAARIRALLEGAPMPAAIGKAAMEAYRHLAAGDTACPVAVRSSATAEDLPEASFAGQQETYLNVRGEASLLTHVQRCWASLWTARAIAYRERNGFDHRQVSLAVVVQAMVDPEIAGVLFTANPVNGSREEMLINAAYGLGESVVSGRVTPDTYRLARQAPSRLLEKSRGAKEIAIRFQTGGGTVTEPVSQAERDRDCLTLHQLQQLVALGLRVEAHYGAPQDIEWAIAGGQLYLLQTRPITTLAGPAPAPRRLSRIEHTILDDILEHYPDPPYPLDYQAVTDGYEQLQESLRDWGLRIPPATTVIRMDEQGIPTVVPVAPRPTWRLLGLAGHLRRTLAREAGPWVTGSDPHYANRITALQAVELATLSDAALADHIDKAVALATELGRIRFAQYIVPMVSRGNLLRVLVRLAGGPRLQTQTDLLGGLSYKSVQIDRAMNRLAGAALADPAVAAAVVSSPPNQTEAALQAVPGGPALLEQVAAFLAEHGARTMKVYLPFSNASWSEDPSALWPTLAALIRRNDPAGAEARHEAAAARFAALQDQVAGRLPGPLRRRFLDHLGRFRAEHVAREATLYAIEVCFLAARRAVREAARRLTAAGALPDPDAVLYLTLSELTAALKGTTAAAHLRQTAVSRRRARPGAAAAWRGPTAPPSRGEAGELKGLAGSPGQATGPVKVIAGPAEFGKLQQGDILVCAFTDPAWTPLFALAAGVVSDTGGPLSHAAIVAREYGIPAVLGTQTATQQLRDGDVITVNGYGGKVIRRQNTEPSV